jgi:hypothetical protein
MKIATEAWNYGTLMTLIDWIFTDVFIQIFKCFSAAVAK